MNNNANISNNGFSRIFANYLKSIFFTFQNFAENFKNTSKYNSFYSSKNFRQSALFSPIFCVLFFLSISVVSAQDLPDKIRGYKVHKAKVAVKAEKQKSDNSNKSSENEAFVNIGEPEILDISLTGITFELAAELSSIEQSGTVDFLTFHDFRVNGLKVEVEEYKESFDFKKTSPVILPKPFKIFLGTGQALSGALKEIKDSKEEWRVTGRVFVFGHFKKSFLKFKRVVPVNIDILIKNPVKNFAENAKKKDIEN